MKYDFNTVVNRRGTNCIKYDSAGEHGIPEDALPMWVADMDFPAPPETLADLQEAVSHGIFGYTEPTGGYYDSVAGWFAERFGYHAAQGEIVTMPGVVYGLAQCVRAFTQPGDSVIIQTPVYFPFYSVVRDNGRNLVTNPLIYQNGKYYIDFEDFEQKIVEYGVKMFILCGPHNPVSRVWTREELSAVNDICVRHGVVVVSDEIHCDFVWPGHTHTCFGLLNEDAVIATAPSKTFNLAGLQISNYFIKNENLRGKLQAEIHRGGYGQVNTMGIISCQSSYTRGGPWLDALNAYLWENIRILKEFLKERLPKIKFIEPEGTYLMWLDFSAYGLTQEELDQRVTEGAKLWLNSGTMFGSEGEGFQRVNIACPRATLTEALHRLESAFSK